MYNFKWDKYNSDVFFDAKKLRELVFILEQGFKEEFDDYDKTCDHLVMYDEKNNPIATARVILNYQGKKVSKVGRIVVTKELRKNGLGRLLLKEVEKFSKKNGMLCTQLGAQMQAFDFYKKLGYNEYGVQYLEESTPHIDMLKIL